MKRNSLYILPAQQLKNIAYLSYAHLMLDYAYEAHIKFEGEQTLEGQEREITNNLMIELREYLGKNGWTYNNLAKNAHQSLRNYYNMIDPCVAKYFKKDETYIPSFLALVMIYRAREWKGLEIPHLEDALSFFVKKMNDRKSERSKYYKVVGEITKTLKIKATV